MPAFSGPTADRKLFDLPPLHADNRGGQTANPANSGSSPDRVPGPPCIIPRATVDRLARCYWQRFCFLPLVAWLA